MQRNTFERSRSEPRIECVVERCTSEGGIHRDGGPRILSEGRPCKLIYRTKGNLFPAVFNAKRMRGPGVAASLRRCVGGEHPKGVNEASQIRSVARDGEVETRLGN
jgi:hypothetical protein